MNINNKLLKISFVILVNIFYMTFSMKAFCFEIPPLDLAKQVIETIKKDENNVSYTTMINNTVMKQHILSHHKENQPYFYTDSRSIIAEIVSMVVEHPENAVYEGNDTGILKIYRSFNFDRDIAPLMFKDTAFAQNKIKNYLGATPQAPTNQVVVLIKINDFKNLQEKLQTGHSKTRDNLIFLNAYPVLQTH